MALFVLATLFAAEAAPFAGEARANSFFGKTLSFASEPVPLNRVEVYESLDQELLLISEAKARIFLSLRRIPRTLPVVEKALKDEGVPDDLKFYPLTLTGLAPEYRSGKRLGIWRLSEDEAASMGLTVNKNVDERMDPVASSRAAAKKLKANKNVYGSWTSAMASLFDAGAFATAVLEAEGETDYHRLYVPEALEKSVSQVMAGKILFSDPERYGYKTSKTWPVLARERVRLGEDGNMRKLADHYKLDYKTFRDMNPHVLTDTVPAGSYLNVP
ncbi:MAG: transglycosylase SLT domain-containing protein [Deltaproteobacteria bacterium]|jgi:hypothetical protein|nr:transglycosylase SLT domain-containing protein [Deltaproteobacteria bacterium]